MTKRMLIDATHAEETRVVVLDGNRLEDFDVETAAKQQLKGNIYLAKVVRVEPSLQAAFVEYGGGRHGFLAFGEIHPDYYQIPVADRQRLLEMQEAEARAEEAADDAAAAADEAAERGAAPPEAVAAAEPTIAIGESAPLGLSDESAIPGHGENGQEMLATAAEAADGTPTAEPSEPGASEIETSELGTPELGAAELVAAETEASEVEASTPEATETGAAEAEPSLGASLGAFLGADMALEAAEPAAADSEDEPAEPNQLAATEDEPRDEEAREQRQPSRFMRSYKIQEVIRRRQILLIQVVKEERGSKGAALTTYISLAGRFSVLMPNSPRGGGISRKITSTADRRRLKEVTSELQIPRGMGLIVRTAGANRPKAEIKRDCEYLLELWDSIRETTMQSMAPALIHEEASLIKRSIRDNYARDVEEVLVDGEAGWRAARDFMRMLMPAHARKVVLWTDPQPLFARHAVEAQLDAMLVPTVQLKSGGYLVINQTEALVAIDVNSGRSTRERGIEETALKTNLEASDEVARQLRLRDLAGLIVIDYIDMESRRNNAAVEKRLKDALKDDRARIQLGSISSFGLMEMSRQRLRPSLAETSFTPCPHCGGTGHVRSTETSALAVLRAIEDEGAKRRAAEICVHVAAAIALYVLNHKRTRIAEIEARYGMSVSFAADETLLPPATRIERLRAQVPGDLPEQSPPSIARSTRPVDAEDAMVEEPEDEPDDETPEAAAATPGVSATQAEADAARRRRRRRRGGRREESGTASIAGTPTPGLDAVLEATLDPADAEQPDMPAAGATSAAEPGTAESEEARGRRRGRRGGRRRRRDEPETGSAPAATGEDDGVVTDEPASFDAPPRPAYTGPTPADPFGGAAFDIYDVMEQAEARAAALPPPVPNLAAPRPHDEIEAAAAEATVPAEVPAAAEAVAAPVAEPIAEAVAAPITEAVAEPASLPDPVAPEPVAAEPAIAEPAAPVLEPVAMAPPRSEPVSAPVAAPVVIGETEAPAEKKRGWWSR